MLINAGKTQI